MIFRVNQVRTDDIIMQAAPGSPLLRLQRRGGQLAVGIVHDAGATIFAVLDHHHAMDLYMALDQFLDPGKYMEEIGDDDDEPS